MVSLQVLRRQAQETPANGHPAGNGRFDRLRADDARPRNLDLDGLEAELRRTVDGEVRFDDGARALYATDGSNYRQVPICVVIPRTIDALTAAVAAARKFGAPVLNRGGGTSLAGQCCNVAVVIDNSKYLRHVAGIDADARLATVEPGCVLDDMRNQAKTHGLNFAPDPATHTHCTLGGMLGNNSCGIHSLLATKHGRGMRVSDNTESLEILTYDGVRMTVGPTSDAEYEKIVAEGGRKSEIYRALKKIADENADLIREKTPNLPRRVSGYNLIELLPENGFNVARALVGTEGTCVTILSATMNLVPEPKARSLLVLGYPDIFHAGDHVMEIRKFMPTGLEGIDHLLFDYEKKKGTYQDDLEMMPEGKGFCMVEFGGDSKQDSDDQARACMEMLKGMDNPPSMKLFDKAEEEERIWQVREAGLGSTAFVPDLPDMWPGWEDSAVPPEKVGPYLRDLKKLFNKFGYNPSLYGHLGQGCIHCRVGFDLYTAEGIANYRGFMDEAVDLVLSYGGSLSGEHGDGQSRGEYLPRMYGDEMIALMRQFKLTFDPQWKMNPGKVIDPYGATTNLRLGTDYNPPQPDTYFSYPADKGSFSRAVLRCVGVGKCRREGGGTMCPSYMVTHEEAHSTRGRSRLMFEMMNGEVLDDGWRSEPVREALDLCLACKGCKDGCPVNVDMATYKAEFLSHYYEGKLRPRHMFAFGFIGLWSQLAGYAPTLMNVATQTPGLSRIAKWMANIAPRREIPPFAPQSFKDWFKQHEPKNPAGRRVVLYADTFNNYYNPDTAIAAVEVLEDAGCRVIVPPENLCCGRPLYDYGFLPTAIRWMRQNLEALRPYVRDGVPMVVLEPSCCATFRDELTNLFPTDHDARRLKNQTFTIAEYLDAHAGGYDVPKMSGRALVHGHCHQKAIMGIEGEKRLYDKMGLQITVPDSGCCGMAGAFGYENTGGHYETSIAVGERVLLPDVRKQADDTLIVTDGFSCREQILQDTDRVALHTAQVLQRAIHQRDARDLDGRGGRPETSLVEDRHRRHADANRRLAVTAATVGAAALATYAVWRGLERYEHAGDDWF